MENEIFNLFTAFQTVFYENFTFFIVTMVMLLFDILSGMAAHIHKKILQRLHYVRDYGINSDIL